MKYKWASIYLFLSSIMLSVSTIMVRILSNHLSGLFIAFFRFCIGIILCITVLFFQRLKIQKIRFKSLIYRGIFGSVSMILFFISIQLIGSGRSTLLLNLYPVSVLIFGFLFFSEKTEVHTIITVTLCVIGIFFVFSDQQLPSFIGAAVGLSAGLIRGIGVHFIKKSSSENHVALVYLAVCVFGLILLPIIHTEFSHIDNFLTLVILIIIGLLTFGAQMLLALGLRFTSAISGSIISYSSIPITVCLSLFIGEGLNWYYLIGIFLIIAGILINIISKKRESLHEKN